MSAWKALLVGCGVVLGIGAVQAQGSGRYVGFPMADGNTWVVLDTEEGTSCRFSSKSSSDITPAAIERLRAVGLNETEAAVAAMETAARDCRQLLIPSAIR